ncbi:MAG: peptidoglycan-binding domain-containing protein [Terracidiphilus sp.]
MLLSRASLAFLLSAAVVAAPAFATTATTSTTHKKTSTSHAHSAHTIKSSSKTHKASKSSHHKQHGQQGIDSSRATEIQKALIREHYMTGEANGQWDSTTMAAMQKFQADQGWQTKLMPDSRALKKLGLGPDYSNAINASGSSFAEPKSASDLPPAQAAGFASAAGVNR